MAEYPPTKQCSKCRETLPRAEFYKNKGRPDGIQTVCKRCTKLNNASWRAANPGAHKRHYTTRSFTPEQIEERKQRAHEWHQANPERARETRRAWNRANPEKARRIAVTRAQTRRARLLGAFVEPVDPQVLFERDNGICGICGDTLDPKNYEVDHNRGARPRRRALLREHAAGTRGVQPPQVDRARPSLATTSVVPPDRLSARQSE